MMARGILLVIAPIVVALYDPEVAIAGALLYAAAFTFELALSLTLYFQGKDEDVSVALAAAEEFQPQHEFELDPWIPLELGPIDMSINKAVVYLWVGALATILFGIWVMRFGLAGRRDADDRQEALYDLIQGQIAESSLPVKAIGRWTTYVATLFLFIWVLNIVGFIPLPISSETFNVLGADLPDVGHLRGDRQPERHARARVHHVRRNARGGVPLQRRGQVPEELGAARRAERPAAPHHPARDHLQFMRLISLSVRLFANMLAGHMLILVMIGLIFIFGNLASRSSRFRSRPGCTCSKSSSS